MNIALIQDQLAHIELTIQSDDEFDVYGGTTRAGFEFEQVGTAQWHVTVRESEVAGAPLRTFDIYARQRSTGREWVVLSGRIFVKPRTADIEGDKLSPVEYHVSVPVVDSVLETQGMAIVTGIPGPQGPKGPKGDPGDGNVTPEAIQQVVPIAWGSTGEATANLDQSVAVGNIATAGYYGTALGYKAQATASSSIAIGVEAKASGSYSAAMGENCESKGMFSRAFGWATKAENDLSLTIGSQFTETIDGVKYIRECRTYGTGSITIGAGANTKNNGTTESSNSVTIGCKALNQGADSVVIGAQASGGMNQVVIGAGANALYTGRGQVVLGSKAKGLAEGSTVINGASAFAHAVAIGIGSTAGGTKSVALGDYAKTSAYQSTAIGSQANAADRGAVVFSSVAEGGTKTQLYFSGANTPLANTYEGGEAMMGYVVRDSAGNVMTDAEGNAMVGTQKLSVLFPNNRGENAFTPAMLGLDDEWTPKPMFHPSDLDMPTEEPSEPEEYQPLPVWPIVEPEVDELRTPTQAD